jgi:hypothetical protein
MLLFIRILQLAPRAVARFMTTAGPALTDSLPAATASLAAALPA